MLFFFVKAASPPSDEVFTVLDMVWLPSRDGWGEENGIYNKYQFTKKNVYMLLLLAAIFFLQSLTVHHVNQQQIDSIYFYEACIY